MKRWTNKKVVLTGHVIEIYQYEKGVSYGSEDKPEKEDHEDFYNWELEPAEPRVISDFETFLTDLEAAELAERKKRQNAYRARNMIRRLCLANFSEHSKFVTLTFRDGSIRDVTSLDDANAAFKKFVQRLRRKYGSFRYIAVIEFQDKNGRGAVHYHMMSDLPYIANSELAAIWRNGFVRINDIKHVDNVGAYMVKYMTKDVDDDRLAGRKSYLTSKNLAYPNVLRGEEAENFIDQLLLEEGIDQKKVFTSLYTGEHVGQITYTEYNLKRSIS